MLRTPLSAILILAIIAILSEAGRVKRKDASTCLRPRHFRGCIASLGKCQCLRTNACTNPFPYRTKNECRADIKGLGDKCREHPCVNGECVQLKHGITRSWYCECAGTGYHGHRCHKECPRHTDPLPVDYPPACAMVEDEDIMHV